MKKIYFAKFLKYYIPSLAQSANRLGSRGEIQMRIVAR